MKLLTLQQSMLLSNCDSHLQALPKSEQIFKELQMYRHKLTRPYFVILLTKTQSPHLIDRSYLTGSTKIILIQPMLSTIDESIKW